MKMSMQFGLEGVGQYCKRQFRWLFVIPKVCGDESPGANALPPEKGSRPIVSFKEMNVNHLNEEIFYPAKPEWKPITITVFDLARNKHPVFEWIKQIYDPENGVFLVPKSGSFIKECQLKMLDAVGNTIETWIFEDAWPQAINFQSLDMSVSAIVTCEITLRYGRAYIINN